MNIWLRKLGCEGYEMSTIDSLDGLCCEGTGDDGIPMYYELPHDFDAKYDDGTRVIIDGGVITIWRDDVKLTSSNVDYYRAEYGLGGDDRAIADLYHKLFAYLAAETSGKVKGWGLTPKLCFVYERGNNEFTAYFTTQPVDQQWGDDWNDRPYEHNAGEPYTWRYESIDPKYSIITLDVNVEMELPNAGYMNSPYSVEDLNHGAHPWLSDRITQTYIYAGCEFEKFKQLIQFAGGTTSSELITW